MRIYELVEGKIFKDSDFTQQIEGGREINFDLVEDLVYFMNHDDHIYRRNFYPAIIKYVDLKKENKDPKASIFKDAVAHSYHNYIKKFPIRELPDHIDDEICEQACDKIKESLEEHIADGHFKD